MSVRRHACKRPPETSDTELFHHSHQRHHHKPHSSYSMAGETPSGPTLGRPAIQAPELPVTIHSAEVRKEFLGSSICGWRCGWDLGGALPWPSRRLACRRGNSRLLNVPSSSLGVPCRLIAGSERGVWRRPQPHPHRRLFQAGTGMLRIKSALVQIVKVDEATSGGQRDGMAGPSAVVSVKLADVLLRGPPLLNLTSDASPPRTPTSLDAVDRGDRGLD